VKIFRFFIIVLVLALVAAGGYFFFSIEKKSGLLNKEMLKGEAIYSKSIDNDSIDYLKFKAWLAYKKSWENEPRVKTYFYLKELDSTYINTYIKTYIPSIPDLKTEGRASFALCCLLVLFIALFLLLITRTKPSKKKAKVVESKWVTHNERPRTGQYRIEQSAYKPDSEASPTPKTNNKPDVQTLLRKAAKCAESESMQAISYLEQALDESLSPKLATPALLLCGSLRLKNKIGEDQGMEQLERIISQSPQSTEAKKAKMILNTFK